jgi:uncharacterized DUF497 family protein
VPRIVSHWLKTATQRRDTLETAIGELPRPRRYTWVVEFEWDPEKAASNLNKHGVAFTEAMTIFGDPFEVTIPDPDHSDDEFRFLSMGLSESNRLLVVAYTERDQRTRIISAREASPKEWREYESTSR